MIQVKSKSRPRSTVEDKLRAVGYISLTTWSVVYFFFPPVSSLEAVDWVLRGTWMLVTFIAGLMMVIGALKRIDLKLEFPGLLLAILATSAFSFTQLYFAVTPDPAFGNPESRYALVIYSGLPPLLFLPRAVSLWIEAHRLKKVNREAQANALRMLKGERTGSIAIEGKKK